MREAAEAVVARHDVRFDNGEARPLGAKGRRTRARILAGATEAFLDQGWAATTMASVADRSGVGIGTIYQYFRGKEDVLAALVGQWTLAALSQLQAWDPADGRDGLRRIIDRFVSGYVATAPLQQLWEEVSLTDEGLARLRDDLTEVYVQLFATAFERGAAEGLLDPGPAPTETARALCAMVDRYCHQVFGRGRPAVARPSVPAAIELLTGLWATALALP
ncbi:MAG: TetR/AcrR family transcriptional regulator [Actinomycetota bacterium]